jgi:hypothetical protein
MVFGDFVFTVPVEQYNVFAEDVRSTVDYNHEAALAEIKRRLGLPNEVQ